MTTQREQLELAARACGFTPARMDDDGKALLLVGVQEPWNPLDNSADCAAMRARLRIDTLWGHGCVTCIAYSPLVTSQVLHNDHNNDPEAAERAACVAVAAEIGRRMK